MDEIKVMDVLEQLQNKIEVMLQRLEHLELENMELRDELAKERQDKQTVVSSIDSLLGRIQRAISD